jgi:hypothetical protein
MCYADAVRVGCERGEVDEKPFRPNQATKADPEPLSRTNRLKRGEEWSGSAHSRDSRQAHGGCGNVGTSHPSRELSREGERQVQGWQTARWWYSWGGQRG